MVGRLASETVSVNRKWDQTGRLAVRSAEAEAAQIDAVSASFKTAAPISSMDVPPRQQVYQRHRSAPGQEGDIPVQPVRAENGLIDVVDTQQLVVDKTFDEFEGAKSGQNRDRQAPGRPEVNKTRRAP